MSHHTTPSNQRLKELATQVGVIAVPKELQLQRPSQPLTVASDADRAQAISLLAERRRQKPEYKDASAGVKGLLRSATKKEKLNNPETWTFSGNELDEGLEAAVVSNAETGLLAALLNLGANVNVIRAPEPTKKDKGVPLNIVPRRSIVLTKAASLQRASTLRVLANDNADQTALDNGLQAALEVGSRECIQIFLARGANINSSAQYFDAAMLNGEIDNVRLFLRAPRALEVDKLSNALAQAVNRKSLPLVSILLAHGADPNFGDTLAFKSALQTHNFELAIALASLSRVPIRSTFLSEHSLTQVMGIRDQGLLKKFTELLLCCGMRSTTLGLPEMLIKATKDAWIEMAILLTSHGVSPDYNEAESLKFAVRNANYTLTDVLLSCHISPTNACKAMELVPKGVPSPNRTTLIRKLISKGATGAPLGKLLSVAVDQRDSELICLLVQNNAPIDENNGQVLCSAMSARNFGILTTLLDGHPSVKTLNNAFSSIRQLLPATDWLKATRLLLRAGAKGMNVHSALIQAVGDGSESTELIKELLRNGSDVNYKGGQCVKLAVESENTNVLKLLCGARPDQDVVSDILPLTLLSNGQKRRDSAQMIGILLSTGAKGKPLSQTLINAINGGIENMEIIRMLVQNGADINYDDALPLVKALNSMSILDVLLDSRILQQSSVDRVLTTALQSSNSFNEQLRLILRKCKDMAIINKLLVSEIDRTNIRVDIIDLLLEFGADVNYQDGIALVLAIGKKDVRLTKKLLQNAPNSKCRDRAFLSILNLRNEDNKLDLMTCVLHAGVTKAKINKALVTESMNKFSTQDLNIVELLIDSGADTDYNDGEVLTCSAGAQNVNLTKILLHTKPSRSNLSSAFRTLIENSSKAVSERTVQIAAFLLQAGIDDSVRDDALYKLLHPDRLQWNSYARQIVDLLLRYGADVNGAAGACFEFAAKKNDTGLLNKLMDHGPNFDIIFPRLIDLGLKANILVSILDLCFKHESAPADMNTYDPSGAPLLFSTMERYQQNAEVISFLLNHGCSANDTIPYYLDPSIGMENITALLWALAPQNRISSAVIFVLLKAGASATFQSSCSRLTPIALAARETREDIVSELVQRNANVSVLDTYERSPLFYACRNSATNIARILISKMADRDDGSLHEAAKNMSIDIATLLIAAGHSPDAPSPQYSGRSTLGEMCLNAQDISSAEERNKLRRLIKLLLANKSNPKVHDIRKSTVILALDNGTDPYSMTKTLLDTEIYATLNDPEHVYFDIGSGLCYSPLSYVEHEMYAKSPEQKEKLIQLLQSKRCRSSFYSKTGTQPINAIGMPNAAQREYEREVEHRTRLRREQEVEDQRARQLEKSHQSSIIRQKEIGFEALSLQAEKYSAMVGQQQDLHQRKVAAVRGEFNTQAQLEDTAHKVKLQRLDETERRQLAADADRHRSLIDHEEDHALVRRAIKDQENAADLDHGLRLILQQNKAQEARNDAEHQALLNREAVSTKMAKTRLDLMRESARLQSSIAADNQSQRAIGWDEPD